MQDKSWFIASFPPRLIFRYHLPLKLSLGSTQFQPNGIAKRQLSGIAQIGQGNLYNQQMIIWFYCSPGFWRLIIINRYFLKEFTMFCFLVDEKIKHIILACSFEITF